MSPLQAEGASSHGTRAALAGCRSRWGGWRDEVGQVGVCRSSEVEQAENETQQVYYNTSEQKYDRDAGTESKYFNGNNR